MLSTTAAHRSVADNLDRHQAATAAQGDVRSATNYRFADGVGGTVAADPVLNLFASDPSAQGGVSAGTLLSPAKLNKGG